ncbi:hypothetical protein COW80_01720 [Candidatus Beckwithbacteria bacterium CG22_combo_CG10-13_8_21_14_all_01_47_9]|uniref:GIY-YIG domain-containing protein n=4 Tax=Candidatus Beckwithiibacteriota TaxID=1752726 RepID=A0A2H0E179_9BACT|nr:MAG: hypothetical protein COW80_01720 [Candidatus Beckwithbacteria bacterium CG22_combo_CG10-13_8_21_14_all_01_47_9]PJA22755.1 MAG: hypothetical protein COX59_02130 [Candidatus Beckwithbacteria bacterium CG_4_10_14_0_2_um_filter_47_25]PJC66674.1 MAG: hypothetical protein CO018_00665 [Candidatus Beckwithbacteria bacterium CG_4_9_14_0_2_um_filter_47_11]
MVRNQSCQPEADPPWAEKLMNYVYILYSHKLKKIYKGCTTDLKTRLTNHNIGRVRWELIYYEAFINKIDSRREELFLKSGKGRERVKYLLQNTIKFGGVG